MSDYSNFSMPPNQTNYISQQDKKTQQAQQTSKIGLTAKNITAQANTSSAAKVANQMFSGGRARDAEQYGNTVHFNPSADKAGRPQNDAEQYQKRIANPLLGQVRNAAPTPKNEHTTAERNLRDARAAAQERDRDLRFALSSPHYDNSGEMVSSKREAMENLKNRKIGDFCIWEDENHDLRLLQKTGPGPTDFKSGEIAHGENIREKTAAFIKKNKLEVFDGQFKALGRSVNNVGEAKSQLEGIRNSDGISQLRVWKRQEGNKIYYMVMRKVDGKTETTRLHQGGDLQEQIDDLLLPPDQRTIFTEKRPLS